METDSGWIIETLQSQGGLAVALGIICVLFYRLIWRVWDRAMTAKDAEIERLVKERDRYQSLVFERLLSSDPERSRARGDDSTEEK